jgi:hypothetical protein
MSRGGLGLLGGGFAAGSGISTGGFAARALGETRSSFFFLGSSSSSSSSSSSPLILLLLLLFFFFFFFFFLFLFVCSFSRLPRVDGGAENNSQIFLRQSIELERKCCKVSYMQI